MMKMKDTIVLGVDIGGSHITAGLVDLETGTLFKESYQRKHVSSSDSAEVIFDNWCNVMQDSFSSGNVLEKSIGIAIPGPFDYEEGISLIRDQDKFKNLYRINVKNELARRLNIKPDNIRLINDAAAFLKGEVFGGAARGYKSAIGLTLGTGLGSAFFEKGVTRDAALWESPFKDGIAEDYLSTGWFIKKYAELSGKTIKGVKELNCAENPDRYALLLFEEFGNHLGQFIERLLDEQPADAIVLGGNITKANACFLPYLKQSLANEACFSKIKIARLNEDAALIGAAACWNSFIEDTKINTNTNTIDQTIRYD